MKPLEIVSYALSLAAHAHFRDLVVADVQVGSLGRMLAIIFTQLAANQIKAKKPVYRTYIVKRTRTIQHHPVQLKWTVSVVPG